MEQEFERRITALETQFKSLGANATIPLEIGRAFKQRLGGNQALTVSGKSASSENVIINEGGSANVPVLQPPDGFITVTIEGNPYFLAYWT